MGRRRAANYPLKRKPVELLKPRRGGGGDPWARGALWLHAWLVWASMAGRIEEGIAVDVVSEAAQAVPETCAAGACTLMCLRSPGGAWGLGIRSVRAGKLRSLQLLSGCNVMLWRRQEQCVFADLCRDITSGLQVLDSGPYKPYWFRNSCPAEGSSV